MCVNHTFISRILLKMDPMTVQSVDEFCLRPSSQTPPHLRDLRLSLLDQLLPCPYAPIVFFYRSDQRLSLTHKLKLLKDSLSQILVRFYPFAGKIKDEFTIDCNDDGLRYLEAQVNCDLNDFLNQPDLLVIQNFLPVDPSSPNSHVANVQVNVFTCGGIAIGLCISHKILDGAGLGIFMNDWAATARGESGGPPPDFNSASAFPAKTLWLKQAMPRIWGPLFKPGNFITKRFIFDSSSVTNLRHEASHTCLARDRPPTRIQAVSALIWKIFINVRITNNNGISSPSTLTHLVNLRPRAKKVIPNITDRTLGNMLWIGTAKAPGRTNPEPTPELGVLSEEIRSGIAKIDGEFVKQLQGDDETEVQHFALNSLKGISDSGPDHHRGALDAIAFTSWCRLGFYDADFGWGRPVWISSLGVKASVYFNIVTLMDTRDGEGVEAWVILDEKDMRLLEKDSDIRKFASVDSSPVEHQFFAS